VLLIGGSAPTGCVRATEHCTSTLDRATITSGAYYGRGFIDCGSGHDAVRAKLNLAVKLRKPIASPHRLSVPPTRPAEARVLPGSARHVARRARRFRREVFEPSRLLAMLAPGRARRVVLHAGVLAVTRGARGRRAAGTVLASLGVASKG
jgi:hypothetical protein